MAGLCVLVGLSGLGAHAVVLVSPGYPDVFSGMTVTLVSLLDNQTATLPDTTTWQVLEGPVHPRSGTGKTFALTITGAGPVTVEVTAHWPTWSRYATWQSLAHTWTLTGSRYVSWTPSETNPPFSWTLAVEPPMNGAMAWTSDETSLEIHLSSDGTSAGFTRFTPHPTSEGVEVRIAPPGLPLALTPIHRRLTLFELSWAVVNGWTDLPFGQSVHLRARITPEDLGPCSWTVVNLTRLEANTLPANEVKVQRAPRVAVSDAEPARPAPPVASGPSRAIAGFTPPGGGTLAALCLPLPMSPLQIDHERSTHWVALSDPPWSLPLTMAGRIHAVIPPDTLSLIGTGPGTAMSTRALTPVTGVWQSTLWSPALPGTLTVRLQATWGTTLKTSPPFPVLLAHLGIQAPTQMIVGVPITLWAIGTGLPPGCQYYWKYINLGGQGTFSSTLTTEPWTVWTPTHEGGVCFWVGAYVPDEDGGGYWLQSRLAEGTVVNILGPDAVFELAQETYTSSNNSTGTWSVSPEGTVASGGTGFNFVTVNWGAGPFTGSVNFTPTGSVVAALVTKTVYGVKVTVENEPGKNAVNFPASPMKDSFTSENGLRWLNVKWGGFNVDPALPSSSFTSVYFSAKVTTQAPATMPLSTLQKLRIGFVQNLAIDSGGSPIPVERAFFNPPPPPAELKGRVEGTGPYLDAHKDNNQVFYAPDSRSLVTLNAINQMFLIASNDTPSFVWPVYNDLTGLDRGHLTHRVREVNFFKLFVTGQNVADTPTKYIPIARAAWSLEIGGSVDFVLGFYVFTSTTSALLGDANWSAPPGPIPTVAFPTFNSEVQGATTPGFWSPP